MNINEQFPSKYLKSTDLKGDVATVKIKDVVVEEIGSDRKMVAYFAGKEKGMVINKTNAHTIGEAYGQDTDEWIGQPIEIFSMKVEFNGRMVDGLRVRVPSRRQSSGPAMAPNARARAEATERESPAPDLDDDIPF